MKIVRNKLGLILLGILVVILPIVIIVLQQRQETRSKASGNAVVFSFNPDNASAQVSQPLSALVSADAKTYRLTGIDVSIFFDARILEVTSFTPSSSFNTELIKDVDNNQGRIRYAAVNTTASAISGVITIGTINFRAKAVGNGDLHFLPSPLSVTAEGQTNTLSTQVQPASYNVISSPTSPTPTTVPAHSLTGDWNFELGYSNTYSGSIVQSGNSITGTYRYSNFEDTFTGTISGNSVTGTYGNRFFSTGQVDRGTFSWTISADYNSFQGRWVDSHGIGSNIWNGTRTSGRPAAGLTVRHDLNGDGRMDQGDVDLLDSCFGRSPTGTCTTSDLDHDGDVDGVDRNILFR